ncbi:hypothetical protein K9K77_02060, partial [Candidatus Babeliales bacterium]|nr:hypothetical protein [Candidatus Babeliales bacterium]
VVPNQKLLDVVDDQVSMIDGFAMINDVLNKSVKGVSDIITRAGHINVDFADVREVMRDQGLAVMGTGIASGEGRARRAVIDAISSPLLENRSIAGARGVLLNISGSSSLGLHEISDAASVIYEQAHEDANIILGSVIDESLGENVSVTVIATGFEEDSYNVQVKGTLLARDAQDNYLKQERVYQPERVQAAPAHTMYQQPSYKQEIKTPEYKPAPVQEAKQEIKYEAKQEIKYEAPAQKPQIQVYQEATKVEAAPVQKAPQQRCEVNYAASVKAAPEQEELSYKKDQEQEELYADSAQGYEEEEFESSIEAEGNELERGGSELGSNVIQLKDLDVPTFMRKPNQGQEPYYGGSKKKNKKKKHRNREQQNYNNR